MCDCCVRCPILRRYVSFDDFGDVETNFLNHIEKEFENQLDHYVELVDMTNFDFQICIYVQQSKWHVVQFDFNGFSFYVCLGIKN